MNENDIDPKNMDPWPSLRILWIFILSYSDEFALSVDAFFLQVTLVWSLFLQKPQLKMQHYYLQWLQKGMHISLLSYVLGPLLAWENI